MRIKLVLYFFVFSSVAFSQSSNDKKEPKLTAQSCGLFKIESGFNLIPMNGFNLYAGYGMLTSIKNKNRMPFFLSTAGLRVHKNNNRFYLSPQISLDMPIGMHVYSKVNVWSPIESNGFDVIISPQLGYAVFLGYGYITLGYNFNTTRRLDFQNGLTLNFGVNLPTNITRIL